MDYHIGRLYWRPPILGNYQMKGYMDTRISTGIYRVLSPAYFLERVGFMMVPRTTASA